MEKSATKPLKEHVNDVVRYAAHEILEEYKKPHVVELEYLGLLRRGHELNQDPDEMIFHLLFEKIMTELYVRIPDIEFKVAMSTRYGSFRMCIKCYEMEVCYIIAPQCTTTLGVAFVGGRRKNKVEVSMDVFTLDTLGVELVTEKLRLDVPKFKE